MPSHALPHADKGFVSRERFDRRFVPAAIAVFPLLSPLFRRCFLAVITAAFLLFSLAKPQLSERFSLESCRR